MLVYRAVRHVLGNNLTAVHCDIQIRLPPVFAVGRLVVGEFVRDAGNLVSDVVVQHFKQVARLRVDLSSRITVIVEFRVPALRVNRVMLLRVAFRHNPVFLQ